MWEKSGPGERPAGKDDEPCNIKGLRRRQSPPREAEISLASISTFAGLSPQDLNRLQAKTAVRHVSRGTVLLRQGDPPDRLYLVLSGRFVVLQDGKPDAIAEIGPGEPLGELAFFAGVERTANVIAARDSKVLVLTAEDYAAVIEELPGVVSTILTAVAKRLARVTSSSPTMRPKRPRTVALLPIGTQPSLSPDFVSQLAGAMAPATVVSVSPTTVAGLSEAADEADLHDYLAGLENEADLLLFAIERRDTRFSRACLSLADQLLLIAPASEAGTEATTPSDFELGAARLFLRSDRFMVVWRGSSDTSISKTATWLNRRDVKLHHHVALDSRTDFERLGRFLSGSARGLVLSGGAALGCAHVGVAKALCDAGEPIDFYGGTSVGAAMGAAMAMGLTPDQILDMTENMFVANRAMQRLTIPLHSLLDHRMFDELLRTNYAGTEIEDLPFNFFAVSSSLTTNDAHIHRRGPTWEAVRASTAIPGVLPPFITANGDVLVDGAMVDNMPLAIMRDLKIGPNLVVRLKRPRPWRVSVRYDGFPTRGNLLRNLVFKRRKPDYPSLATVLIRGMVMTSEQRLENMPTDGDLILTPKGTERVGFLEWQKGRQVADAAYRHVADLLTDAGGLEALIDDAA